MCRDGNAQSYAKRAYISTDAENSCWERVNKLSGKTRWNRFSLRRKTWVSYVKQEPGSRSQFDPWAPLTVRISVQLTRARWKGWHGYTSKKWYLTQSGYSSLGKDKLDRFINGNLVLIIFFSRRITLCNTKKLMDRGVIDRKLEDRIGQRILKSSLRGGRKKGKEGYDG